VSGSGTGLHRMPPAIQADGLRLAAALAIELLDSYLVE